MTIGVTEPNFMTMAASVTTENLRAYRARLADQLNEMETELRRVNAALRAMEEGPGRTFDLLRKCVAREGEVDATTALAYLRAHGWQADARGNPLNAVRTALAHLAGCGEIERVSRGVYRATGELQQENDWRDEAIASTG